MIISSLQSSRSPESIGTGGVRLDFVEICLVQMDAKRSLVFNVTSGNPNGISHEAPDCP